MVKAILGDMLGHNYVVAPGVQGTVTLVTPKPISPAQALDLLETVLGWNNARLIYSGDRYIVVPAHQALAGGAMAPGTGAPSPARGYEVRTVSLRYISASEMGKVLKPYARPDAIVSIDNTRNIISIAGTRAELENYLRTIQTFDVDWLAGMSVGVFPVTSGVPGKVVADLEKVFGEHSGAPVAGMFRFMPLEGANAVLVITSQAKYLDDVQEWLQHIDGAGDEVQLFYYELKNVEAKDLAPQLLQALSMGNGATNVLPRAVSTDAQAVRSQRSATGDTTAEDGEEKLFIAGASTDSARLHLPETASSNAAPVDLSRIRVTAVEESNALIVRSTPSGWLSIKSVIEHLDVAPLQVHIEAQIATVQLRGDLSYGVNWYFANAVAEAGLPSAIGRSTWSQLSGTIAPNEAGWTFLGRNAAAVISALETVSQVQLLQAPSVVVRNNAEAAFNVGSRIPISSITLNPMKEADNTISQVQYLDTGAILRVRPRATRDGTVFLDIDQEISAPVGAPDNNGNVRIDMRKLRTEVALRAGDTIMLAGMIDESVGQGTAGLAGANRIPILGGLFGRRSSMSRRDEVIVLITPTIIYNSQQGFDALQEYRHRFRAVEPFLKTQRTTELR